MNFGIGRDKVRRRDHVEQLPHSVVAGMQWYRGVNGFDALCPNCASRR